jgi:F-type H+-transporting ATPase subunit alpha
LFAQKKKISKKKKDIFSFNYGSVLTVSDEIVHCVGLSKVKFGEIVTLKINHVSYEGLVINISSNITSCVFFVNTKLITPGVVVKNTSFPMRVSVSKNSLGCLVDCLGYIIISSKEKSTSSNSYKYKVERPAPGITQRESIYQPLHTGNILVDSLFPIGRGQRELILGDRQTGKTTVAINAILTQK